MKQLGGNNFSSVDPVTPTAISNAGAGIPLVEKADTLTLVKTLAPGHGIELVDDPAEHQVEIHLDPAVASEIEQLGDSVTSITADLGAVKLSSHQTLESLGEVSDRVESSLRRIQDLEFAIDSQEHPSYTEEIADLNNQIASVLEEIDDIQDIMAVNSLHITDAEAALKQVNADLQALKILPSKVSKLEVSLQRLMMLSIAQTVAGVIYFLIKAL